MKGLIIIIAWLALGFAVTGIIYFFELTHLLLGTEYFFLIVAAGAAAIQFGYQFLDELEVIARQTKQTYLAMCWKRLSKKDFYGNKETWWERDEEGITDNDVALAKTGALALGIVAGLAVLGFLIVIGAFILGVSMPDLTLMD